MSESYSNDEDLDELDDHPLQTEINQLKIDMLNFHAQIIQEHLGLKILLEKLKLIEDLLSLKPPR